eukprot:gene13379-17941_t
MEHHQLTQDTSDPLKQVQVTEEKLDLSLLISTVSASNTIHIDNNLDWLKEIEGKLENENKSILISQISKLFYKLSDVVQTDLLATSNDFSHFHESLNNCERKFDREIIPLNIMSNNQSHIGFTTMEIEQPLDLSSIESNSIVPIIENSVDYYGNQMREKTCSTLTDNANENYLEIHSNERNSIKNIEFQLNKNTIDKSNDLLHQVDNVNSLINIQTDYNHGFPMVKYDKLPNSFKQDDNNDTMCKLLIKSFMDTAAAESTNKQNISVIQVTDEERFNDSYEVDIADDGNLVLNKHLVDLPNIMQNSNEYTEREEFQKNQIIQSTKKLNDSANTQTLEMQSDSNMNQFDEINHIFINNNHDFISYITNKTLPLFDNENILVENDQAAVETIQVDVSCEKASCDALPCAKDDPAMVENKPQLSESVMVSYTECTNMDETDIRNNLQLDESEDSSPLLLPNLNADVEEIEMDTFQSSPISSIKTSEEDKQQFKSRMLYYGEKKKVDVKNQACPNDLSYSKSIHDAAFVDLTDKDKEQIEDICRKRKHELEENAEKSAKRTFQIWQREKQSLERIIDEHFKEYIEIYEKAHALRLQFEAEKSKFVSNTLQQARDAGMNRNWRSDSAPISNVNECSVFPKKNLDNEFPYYVADDEANTSWNGAAPTPLAKLKEISSDVRENEVVLKTFKKQKRFNPPAK